MTRTLSLNAFVSGTGHHEAAWRHPDTPAERAFDATYYQDIARRAESYKLDAVFLADVPGLGNDTGHNIGGRLEPITLLTAVAVATERIGLIATASTSFHDPYNLARLFATLDHISRGRAGWNIVTTQSTAAARNFGLADVAENEDRYERAQEFVDVVTKLLDSWEDDAILNDKASGYYVDPSKVHTIDHVGAHFSVRGPLVTPRPPQGRPVYVQAGASNAGRAFAARNAEAIFTAHQQLGDAQAFYADIKRRAADLGRDPEGLKILPGISPFLGETEQEARDLQHEFNALTLPAYGVRQIASQAGVDLSGLELDERVPIEIFGDVGDVLDNRRSRKQLLAKIVERDRPTLRELLHRFAGARGHNVVAGTPTQVADIITEWFENGAADGFNVMPPQFPGLLDAFGTKVVPLLQERGLFRADYDGTTLRDHLGLARPESQYSADVRSAV